MREIPSIRLSILSEHRLMVELLSHCLERSGLSVAVTGTDARPFLAQLSHAPADLAIVDLGPAASTDEHSGGEEAIREIHAYFPGLPAIALCATNEPHLVERLYEDGAAAVLCKQQLGRGTLLETVLAVARGERLRDADMISALGMPEIARLASDGPLGSLTSRERQVLEYVSAGADNLKIATCLGISERTAKAHISSLYRKLGSETRTHMALLARRLGVRPPSEDLRP